MGRPKGGHPQGAGHRSGERVTVPSIRHDVLASAVEFVKDFPPLSETAKADLAVILQGGNADD
ncbi:MAG: hypothetical protein WC977_12855 [Anaerovoracaceae bacterium]